MQSWAATALRETKPAVFWSDRLDAPEASAKLEGNERADLAIIGGGYSGLWAAIQALEDDPGLRVVVLEATVCGYGASSRNGGFCDSSLTHGLLNGRNHWPDESDTLVRLGRENLAGIEAAVDRHGIEADVHRRSTLDVAREPWQLAELADTLSDLANAGADVALLDAEETRHRLNSPEFLGGRLRRDAILLVDPARLVWELLRTARNLGALVFEHSPARRIERDGVGVIVRTDHGSLRAERAVVATNAFAEPVRQVRRYVIPVWDHVLMTEPLSTDQMASIGWADRDGVGDAANQFHYFRLSEDNRILWGGYDANYHFGGRVDMAEAQNDATHELLARHFFETFPQLEGLRFSHRWGGPIGTTSTFAAAFGTTHGGRVAWVAGYTGLGVGASRFGARVALDLAAGRDNEYTNLEIVRKKPFPFPPEPFRYPIIQLTRRAIHRSDANQGRRGIWLRALDRFGIGFDS